MTTLYLPFAVAIVVIAAVPIVLKLVLKYSKRCTVPGPYGLPYLGLSPFLPSEPYKYFAKLSKTYGGMVYCKLGKMDVIVLNTYEIMDTLFRKRGKVFNNRFLDFPDELDLQLGFADLHFGEKYSELRNFTARTLNELNIGESGTLEGLINDEVSRFCSYIEQSYKTEPIDPSDIILNCTVNIFTRLILGKRLDYDGPELKKLHDDAVNISMVATMAVFYRRPMELKLMKLLNIYPIDNVRRSKDGAIQMYIRSNGDVKQYLSQLNQGQVSEDCFLGKFQSTINKKKANNEKTFMSVNTMKGVLANLFAGGIDSSSILAAWLVVLLTKYQDIQTRLREEIFTKIGRDKMPTLADKTELDYTNAFLQEHQRFGSFAPFAPPHVAAEDTHHNGYFIPKGTYLVANTWAVHHDEELFPNPEEFNPDRFIDGHGKFIKDKNIILFGIGSRSCPGHLLGQRQMFLILMQLLQKFELLPPEGVDPESITLEGTFFGAAIFPPECKTRFIPINRA